MGLKLEFEAEESMDEHDVDFFMSSMSALDPWMVISLFCFSLDPEDSDTVEPDDEKREFCSASETGEFFVDNNSEFGLTFLRPSAGSHLTLIRTEDDFQFELRDSTRPPLPSGLSSEGGNLIFFLTTE